MGYDPALIARLALLLADITGSPATQLSAESSPKNTRGWDSVANLSFIATIEEEFDVSIPTREAMRLHSLGDIAKFLNQVGAKTDKGD